MELDRITAHLTEAARRYFLMDRRYIWFQLSHQSVRYIKKTTHLEITWDAPTGRKEHTAAIDENGNLEDLTWVARCFLEDFKDAR